MKIACVLKVSEEYDTDYVAHFLDGLNKHVGGYEFTLLTGGHSGWWSKMQLFHPSVKGDLLYFDLDTMVVGPLDEIQKVDRLTVLRDFNVPERMASGVMFIPEHVRAEVWADWIKCPDEHIAYWGGHGDGGYLSKFWKDAQRWQDFVPGQIVSYKNHIRGQKFPENVRVVCFHGRPRPRDVRWMI